MRTGLLIAEPDAELRSIRERLPDILGFHVETAGDGLECWTRRQALRPDVLVTGMEIRRGGGVLACLQEAAYRLLCPAVFVTGDAPPNVLARQIGVSRESCFQKPLRLNMLLDLVSSPVAARRTELCCQ